MDTSSGMTERLRVLKERYLKAVPSITIDRALAFTEIARKSPGNTRPFHHSGVLLKVLNGPAKWRPY